MKHIAKLILIVIVSSSLSGCLVTSVVKGTIGTAIDVVDAVTPDIID